MTPGFLAGVLEGFKGTLDVAVDRLGEGSLKYEVEELQVYIASKRQRFEAMNTSETIAAASRADPEFRSAPDSAV
jgi:hypothetical protein